MNKNQMLQMAWIPVRTRLPPNEEKEIITWCLNTAKGIELIVRPSSEARRDAERFLKDPEQALKEWGAYHVFSHWMYIPPPKGKSRNESGRRKKT